MIAKIAVIFGIIFLDQITKYFAKKYLVIIENPTLPFGINMSGFFNLFTTALLLIVFCFFYIRYFYSNKGNLGFYLVCGGALANLIDRLFGGTVTDFINLGFGIINLADMAIMAGVVIMFFQNHHTYNSQTNDS